MVPGPLGPSWRTWGTDAFLLAQRTRRPVLLLLHVAWSPRWDALTRRLVGEAEEAAALEQRAVLLAVDADLRPDIGDRYDPGVLPAAIALTPEGAPLAWCEAAGVAALHLLLDRVGDAVARDRAPALGPAAAEWRASLATGRLATGSVHGGSGSDTAFNAVAAATDAALAATLDHAGGPVPPAAFMCGVHGWAPEAMLLTAATSLDPVPVPWSPRLAWIFDGPLWDADAGACRRAAADGTVLDVRLLEDNARWLLALAVAVRAGAGGGAHERLASLAGWMARQAVVTPAPGLRSWDRAPRSRPVDVEATLRGTRGWMQAADTLGDEAALARAIDLFDAVAAAALRQGAGMAHVLVPTPVLRGWFATQVASAAAALDAAAASGREAYIDLADELLRNSIAKLWNEPAGLFVDRVPTAAGAGNMGLLGEARAPYETNLEAARSLARLAALRRDPSALERARRIVASLSGAALDAGAGGVHWLLTAREIDRVDLSLAPARPG